MDHPTEEALSRQSVSDRSSQTPDASKWCKRSPVFSLVLASFLQLLKAPVSFIVRQISLSHLTPIYTSLTLPSLHLTNPLCLRSPLLTAGRHTPFHDSLTSTPPPLSPNHSPEETHFLNAPLHPTPLFSPIFAVFIPNSSSLTHFWTFRFLNISSRSNLPITNFP